jgi:hypothetical protein
VFFFFGCHPPKPKKNKSNKNQVKLFFNRSLKKHECKNEKKKKAKQRSSLQTFFWVITSLRLVIILVVFVSKSPHTK